MGAKRPRSIPPVTSKPAPMTAIEADAEESFNAFASENYEDVMCTLAEDCMDGKVKIPFRQFVLEGVALRRAIDANGVSLANALKLMKEQR